MASSRAPALAPLYIEKDRSPSSSSTMSPDYFTETTPLAPSHIRTSSSSSDSSFSFSSGARKPSSPRNVYTHCGRHTDQYLFNGKGFADMWKAITKKE